MVIWKDSSKSAASMKKHRNWSMLWENIALLKIIKQKKICTWFTKGIIAVLMSNYSVFKYSGRWFYIDFKQLSVKKCNFWYNSF